MVVRFGTDLGVVAHSYLALDLWQLGYPDQALQHSHMALTLAQEISHPFSLTLALLYAAYFHQWRRETPSYARAGSGRDDPGDGAGVRALGGLWNGPARLGPGYAGTGRGGHG